MFINVKKRGSLRQKSFELNYYEDLVLENSQVYNTIENVDFPHIPWQHII